jgi:hypothetical protein
MKLITLLLFLFAIGCTPQENKNSYYTDQFAGVICLSGYRFAVFHSSGIAQVLDEQGGGVPCVIKKRK